VRNWQVIEEVAITLVAEKKRVEIIIHKLFVQIGLTAHGLNIGVIAKQNIATIIGTVLATET